ncbi:hypothetical protein F383_37191 [Gossypium arboreum]|uniref:Uncharacterized protein n=1 Tax=Gossypium arboreum TaxID=29729 RepID=A0A0B0M6T4_GOSAR|nr:hypothetical protein F383_37191 [Gossypium arboreum]
MACMGTCFVICHISLANVLAYEGVMIHYV